MKVTNKMERYPQEIRASFTRAEANSLNLSGTTKEFISSGWDNLIKKNSSLFNSRLLRVLNITKRNDEIIFEVSPDIEYKDVVGLRFHKNFLEQIPHTDIFQVLSVGSIVETEDGENIFVERNSGDWDRSLELPGGFVPATETTTNLEEFSKKIVASDLGIETTKISITSLMGIIDFKEICEMMLIYKVKLSITFKELRAKSAKNIFSIPDGYSIENHDNFFNISLHHPSSIALKHLNQAMPQSSKIVLSQSQESRA